MKCQKCGFENVDNSTYCINCGSRLDGKIRCPKCGEFIEPDAKACPSCGFIVPHSNKPSSNGFSQKRTQIKSIFIRIFSIVSIVLFALAIFQCWGFYLSFSRSAETTLENFWNGSAVYYLVLNVINSVKFTTGSNMVPSEIVSLWLDTGLKFIFVLLNIVIVTTASILGIVKSINSLKSKTYKCHI